MRRSLSTALVWLAIVFASGLTMGVVGHRYFAKDAPLRVQQEKPSRDQIREDYLKQMRSKIGADEEQISRIVEILDRARVDADARKDAFDTEMRTMQHGVRSAIRDVLNPEQQVRLDEWREERRRQREKRERENTAAGSSR
jgi:Spy/CpxP family protein refolding chaperone